MAVVEAVDLLDFSPAEAVEVDSEEVELDSDFAVVAVSAFTLTDFAAAPVVLFVWTVASGAAAEAASESAGAGAFAALSAVDLGDDVVFRAAVLRAVVFLVLRTAMGLNSSRQQTAQ